MRIYSSRIRVMSTALLGLCLFASLCASAQDAQPRSELQTVAAVQRFSNRQAAFG